MSAIFPVRVPKGMVVCVRCNVIILPERAVAHETRKASVPDGTVVEVPLWWCLHCLS